MCLQLLWVYFAALFSYGRYAYNSGRKNQLRATVARPSFSPSLSLCRFLIHASSMVLLFSLGLSFSFWGALALCQQQKERIISFYRKHQKVMVDGNGFFVAISLCEFTSKASHDIPFFFILTRFLRFFPSCFILFLALPSAVHCKRAIHLSIFLLLHLFLCQLKLIELDNNFSLYNFVCVCMFWCVHFSSVIY